MHFRDCQPARCNNSCVPDTRDLLSGRRLSLPGHLLRIQKHKEISLRALSDCRIYQLVVYRRFLAVELGINFMRILERGYWRNHRKVFWGALAATLQDFSRRDPTCWE
jgi:hypothetical protein